MPSRSGRTNAMWAWARSRLALLLTAAGSFSLGLLIGGWLGWVKLGDGKTDWGTAGEWVGGAATAGALLWAVAVTIRDRRERSRAAVSFINMTVEVGESDVGDAVVRVRVHNFAPVIIGHAVCYAQLGDQVRWARTEPRFLPANNESTTDVRFDGTKRGDQAVRAWVIFMDSERRWWRRDDDSVLTSVHEPPEASSAKDNSWS